ncbi:Uma2 family endonuclease [Streptomonospora sp. DSM 45055]|uniref:Uma2 family endonuclease n=2 Tax=Streptomonospora wellingtoniae TaxID=3075544 RepID=A0ABU2KPC7_9ACTN|nr:Uma2 family endonuclease [Streptomonospora sp. DSM 45055]MDT0301113.1 Uma2 family endonuclease [Streptomonospora sp. DSM 45055]
MSIEEADPQQHPLTVEDLERTPDDGRRYELAEGRLEVSPAPTFFHTLINDRLSFALNSQAPRGFTMVSGAGINFNADRTHHRVPDLSVIASTARESPYLTRAPLLAVEIVSKSSVFHDHHTKRIEYAKFGIESYWIISPDVEEPGILELRLEDGQYRDASQAFGSDLFTTDAPFPVSLVPYWLVADSDAWREEISGNDTPDVD